MKADYFTWLSGDDTGISSKAIMTHLNGGKVRGWSNPSDPADLGRCLRLLRQFPELATRINEMAAVGPVWAALVARWDELRACMESEVGLDWEKAQSAPRTYKLMKDIIAKAEGTP